MCRAGRVGNHRQRKGGSFSGARLGGADQIAPRDHNRDGAQLNRGWVGVTGGSTPSRALGERPNLENGMLVIGTVPPA